MMTLLKEVAVEAEAVVAEVAEEDVTVVVAAAQEDVMVEVEAEAVEAAALEVVEAEAAALEAAEVAVALVLASAEGLKVKRITEVRKDLTVKREDFVLKTRFNRI